MPSSLREASTQKGNCTCPKCRKRPTDVERSVEPPDTLRRDRRFTNHSSFVFNQLPCPKREPTVGCRSALFSQTEGNPLLDGLRKRFDQSRSISEIRDE